ncbi:hypothetical protein FS842_002445 [Serendipita sp. 407]|nr:hypothetical protein FS842_002445 [Serendipita sp. 407]
MVVADASLFNIGLYSPNCVVTEVAPAGSQDSWSSTTKCKESDVVPEDEEEKDRSRGGRMVGKWEWCGEQCIGLGRLDSTDLGFSPPSPPFDVLYDDVVVFVDFPPFFFFLPLATATATATSTCPSWTMTMTMFFLCKHTRSFLLLPLPPLAPFPLRFSRFLSFLGQRGKNESRQAHGLADLFSLLLSLSFPPPFIGSFVFVI